MLQHITRKVSKIVKPVQTSDGAGVKLFRAIGTAKMDRLDPFLMLDEFKSDNEDEYAAGFPDHPHRGFETVTYMLSGTWEHKDHKGNQGLLTPGSVQWMTAGRGIIHSEMPKEGGLSWGFQLWVNLPAKLKMCPPRYQDIPPSKIPEITKDDVTIRIIAGEAFGVKGAVNGIVVDPTYLDVKMPPNKTFSLPVTDGHNFFCYVFEGKGYFGGKEASASSLVAFEPKGDLIEYQTKDSPMRLIMVGGKPLNEPVSQYGPFVMNTKEEIMQALADFRSGNF